MTTRRNRMLGLAIGERGALLAEVSSPGGGRPVVERVGAFAYPAGGATLAQPETLGEALARFLGDQGFTARHVVIGIPGKWVLSKRMEAPPAEPALVAESLRLQAEGEFGGDAGGGEFLFDYAGESSATEGRPVTLMAAPRRQVDQVTAVATAARLRAVAVVPYAMTLGAAAARVTTDARVLLFGPGGAEFVSQRNGHPGVLRYLGPATAAPAMLAGELRRAAAGRGGAAGSNGAAAGLTAVSSASGNGAAHGSAGELLVWNDAAVEEGVLRAFGDSLGAAVRLGDSRALGAAAPDGIDAPAGYAAAVSLALAGLAAHGGNSGDDSRGTVRSLPVDFLHSRLAPPRQVRVRRRTLVIAGASLAAVALVAIAWADLRGKRIERDNLWAELKAGADGVKTAEAAIARTAFAQPWHRADPIFVACLHDVTTAMPEDGQTFLTRFHLNDELRGEISGKSANGDHVFELLDRLRASGRFAEVNQKLFDTPRNAARPGRGAGGSPPSPPQPPPGPPTGMPPGAMPPGVMPPGPGGGPPMPPGAMPGMIPGQGVPMMQDAAAASAMMKLEVAAVTASAAAAPGGPVAMNFVPGGGGPGPQPGGGPQVPPGGMPPGAMPPSAAAGRPTSPDPSAGAGPPPGAGASGAEGEVTFTMTFTYVPRE